MRAEGRGRGAGRGSREAGRWASDHRSRGWPRPTPTRRARLRTRTVQLLVSTILSAQCTDARVNMVTRRCSAKYRPARDEPATTRPRGDGPVDGFFRNRAKSIRGASERLVEAYGEVVPRTMEDGLTLPGVAEEPRTSCSAWDTAWPRESWSTRTCFASRAASGSRGRHPAEVERDLWHCVPREEWIEFSHLLIFHGRRVCCPEAACGACTVFDLCRAGLLPRRPGPAMDEGGGRRRRQVRRGRRRR